MIKQLKQALSKLSELSESEQSEVAQIILAKIENKKPEKNAWDILEDMAGTLEAPEDWSQEHAHYLYGTPKQSEENE